MEIVKTICLSCESALEFPRDFDNVICAGCGTAYRVREHKGAINLSPVEQKPDHTRASAVKPNGSGGLKAIELKMAELDEVIETVSAHIEELKSREQSAPLQIGCAFFGIFGLVLTVFAFFMTVGRTYFGGWLFYLSLAAVILLGLMRMRSRMAGLAQSGQLRDERVRLESGLALIEEERERLQELKEKIISNRRGASAEKNGRQE